MISWGILTDGQTALTNLEEKTQINVKTVAPNCKHLLEYVVTLFYGSVFSYEFPKFGNDT